MEHNTKTGPFIFAISGVKNSGKTTLLEAIIPLLKREGLRVAVIKYDSHDFVSDVPGTDSRRLFDAGADGIALYSPYKYMLSARKTVGIETLLPHFADADLVLLEGAKSTAYRKIEIVRRTVSAAPVCDPVTLAALYTDTDCEIAGVPRIPWGSHEAVAECVLAELEVYRSKE